MGKGDREKSARDRIKEQQAADRKREQRRRIITYTTAGVVAVAALGAGILWNMNRSKSEEAGANLAPITVVADAGVTMGNAGVSKPVIDIYEDFQCPACKELERVSGSTFKNLAAEGKAKVVYHPITIFSEEPTRGNSIRAGAAARCVKDGKQWMAFHDTLFEKQPSETVEGFKIDQLVGWGKDVGVTAPDFEQCVTKQQHAAVQQSYSDKVNKEQNLTGTPTVKLNGVEMDNEVLFRPSELREAVLNAAK
ncbi:DsbA family protein [Nonomuraea endophytica]|uniref:Protein-disulfide isomerase n=1 Tax=Nonomuraea endophytica TaxID=714136 RepID=A0A7W8A0D2_9ACTN|nr:thioredoxin domain-containing protein [Nonomuraea endophytica]MBB5077192.1 protein-disulfide isomerase [Nonomuraea endophytica]